MRLYDQSWQPPAAVALYMHILYARQPQIVSSAGPQARGNTTTVWEHIPMRWLPLLPPAHGSVRLLAAAAAMQHYTSDSVGRMDGGRGTKLNFVWLAMQKLEHQSFAISTGCYLAQMVHIIDYPVAAVAGWPATTPAAAGGEALEPSVCYKVCLGWHSSHGVMSGYPGHKVEINRNYK